MVMEWEEQPMALEQGEFDVVLWWRDHRAQFPRLSQMAIDILSIPAMSSECERTFSQGKLTLSSHCRRMRGSTLELLICLKNWWRGGWSAGPVAALAALAAETS